MAMLSSISDQPKALVAAWGVVGLLSLIGAGAMLGGLFTDGWA